MPIDANRRLVFIHIPKTGGTTIEKILGLYEPWPAVRMDILRGPLRRHGEELHLQHLPLEDIAEIAGQDFSRWYKFAFVRNPWDRLVSSFCFQQRQQDIADAEVKQAFARYVEWVESVVTSRVGLVGHYCHLRPQVEFSLEQLDFVGKFENFQTELRDLLARLRISADRIPHEHKSQRKHYSYYYDETTKNRVASLYAPDVETLGYSFVDKDR